MLDDIKRLAERPEDWSAADGRSLRLLTYLECAQYGITGDAGRIPRLNRLYGLVVERSTREERQDLLERVTEMVEETRMSGNALMPFIFSEPDLRIISTASLNLAMLTPREDDDPLSGPKYLRRTLEEEVLPAQQEIRQGMLLGLLALGDRRTLPLLGRCWDLLDDAHRHELAQLLSRNIVYVSTVEFMLAWLEDCLATDNESLLSVVAGSLGAMALSAEMTGGVRDVERTYPAWEAGDGSPVQHLALWPPAEFGRTIAPRLRALAQREREPRVIPLALGYWMGEREGPV